MLVEKLLHSRSYPWAFYFFDPPGTYGVMWLGNARVECPEDFDRVYYYDYDLAHYFLETDLARVKVECATGEWTIVSTVVIVLMLS